MGIIFRFLSNLGLGLFGIAKYFSRKKIASKMEFRGVARFYALATRGQHVDMMAGLNEQVCFFLKKEQLHPPPHTHMHPPASTPPLTCMTV